MNNSCELCGGKYDFRMVQIDECLNMTGIALSGSKRQVNNDNRFRFCPKCGRELTKENFGGVNFDDRLRLANDATMILNVNNLKSEKEVLQWYVDMNVGGTPHTNEEIERVKQMIEKL